MRCTRSPACMCFSIFRSLVRGSVIADVITLKMTDYRDNFEVAFRHLEAHRYALALETFNKINDDDPALIWWRSICYFALGEFENALTDSEVLLEHKPYSSWACLSIALVRATAPDDHLRDAELAYHYMNRFVATYEGEITWRILSIRAAVHAELKNFEEAVKYSRMSLECAPVPMLDRCKSRVSQYNNQIPFRCSDQSIREALFVREIHCVKCCAPTFFYGDFQGQNLPLCCDCHWGTAESA